MSQSKQIAEVNTDNNGNTGDNNSSYVAGVVLALVAITAGAVYYFRK
jgi:LPXTG-motif cell wall-anchored protein